MGLLRRRRRTRVAFAWVLGAATLAGCGGSWIDATSSDDDGGNSIDAAADSRIDATANDAQIDSAPHDATVTEGSISTDAGDTADADHDAGTPGLITLHVTAWDERELVPYDSAVIVFYDPDGTPHTPILSEDGGTVTETIFPHSALTVSMPRHTLSLPAFDTVDLITYLDINPDEELTVAGTQETPPPSPVTSGYTIVFDPQGDAGADGVQREVGNGCARHEQVGSGVYYTADPCLESGVVSVLSMARVDDHFLAYAEATAPFIDGGATVSDWSWAPAAQTSVAIDGALPSNGTVFRLLVAVRKAETVFLDDNGNLMFDRAIADGGLSPPLTVGLPATGFVDNVAYLMQLDGELRDVYATNALASGLSISASELPPKIHERSLSYDVGNRRATIGFVADGALTGVNGTVAVASWTHGSTSYSWKIVSPSATSVVTSPLTTELVGGHFPGEAGESAPFALNRLTIESVSVASDYAEFLRLFAIYDPTRLIYSRLPNSGVRVRISNTP